MKRLTAFLLTLLLTGCAAPGQPPTDEMPPDNLLLTVWVDEVGEGSIGVTAVADDGPGRMAVDLGQAEISFDLIPGQKVELELLPEIRESYPVQTTAVSVKLVGEADPYQPLRGLLAELGEDGQSAMTPCYAVIHGEVESGQEQIDRFYEAVAVGKPARLLIRQATMEGDSIFTALGYDGRGFHCIVDSSRDQFRGDYPAQREMSYPYLVEYEIPTGGRWVCLMEQEDVTWEELSQSLLSSKIEDEIGHQLVYSLNK